jgi:hypothetical protein
MNNLGRGIAASSSSSALLVMRFCHRSLYSQSNTRIIYSTITKSRNVQLQSVSRSFSSAVQSSQHISLWDSFRARFTSKFWRRLATFVKYTRIPFLIASVYGLGYQQGILECTRNPDALQRSMLQAMLASLGVTEQDITIVQDGNISYGSNKRHHQVAVVGRKYINALIQQSFCQVFIEFH